MPPNARVVVIGLDSAARVQLFNRIEDGDMPNLQRLMKKGCHGLLETPDGMGDDAVWASFYTACTPGEHGRYYFRQLATGAHRTRKFQDSDLRRTPFWEMLSDQGKRVAVIDVPKSPLSTGLNGLQLADWLVHGRDHRTCSWPPETAEHLLTTYGDDRTDNIHNGDYMCLGMSLPESCLNDFLDRLEDSIKRKSAFIIEQLQQGNWDLFLAVFKETHCCLHQCWHLIDTEHPQFRQHHADVYRVRIRHIFSLLDTAIGRIVQVAGPEANIICFSNLDMQTNYTANHLFDDWLIRFVEPLWMRVWLDVYRTALPRVTGRLRKSMRGIHHRLNRFRRVFSLQHNEMSGAIRLNLSGREKYGRIRQGDDASQLCSRLIDGLTTLVNPESGEPIVDHVIDVSETYAGHSVDRLPDYLVVWRRTQPITAAESPATGRVDLPLPEYRPGNHVPGGAYFASGPNIISSADSINGSIIDLAPTVARLLNTRLNDVEGIPLLITCRIPRK